MMGNFSHLFPDVLILQHSPAWTPFEYLGLNKNIFAVNCGGGGPMITEEIGNMTVALGREATLKCVVTHLSDYKVICISAAVLQ